MLNDFQRCLEAVKKIWKASKHEDGKKTGWYDFVFRAFKEEEEEEKHGKERSYPLFRGWFNAILFRL